MGSAFFVDIKKKNMQSFGSKKNSTGSVVTGLSQSVLL
jgi:hypothetical protein